MSGDHNMYGDGNVYRGQRSKDKANAVQLQPLCRKLEENMNRHEYPEAVQTACQLMDIVQDMHLEAIKGLVKESKCYSQIL